MTHWLDTKQNRINDILSYVKLGSIILPGIILLNVIVGDSNLIYEDTQILVNFFLVLLITAVITALYYTWLFVIKKKIKQNNLMQFIECAIFLLFFILIILFTGKQESNYKVILLFIIIIFTIEIGMKFGILLATASSLFILYIDLIYASNKPINQFFEDDLILSTIFYLTAWLLGYYVKLENEHIQMLEDKANIDGLTGLYNHRYFYEELLVKIKQYKPGSNSLALIFMDIDYFKQYNDLYGHLSGDKVLRDVGDMLKRIVKYNALIARYGGDEFAIILTDVLPEKVYSIAEHIRTAMEDMYFEGEEHLSSHNLTMSIGIAICNSNIKSDIDLIKCADDALYRAKFFKKNRVEVYSSILDILKLDIEKEHIDLVTSIKTLISVINAKDRYTYGHIERVVMYSKIFASKLNLSREDNKILVFGAYMHDIGKINISDEILNKRTSLTKKEWEIMKMHPINGVNIIKQVDSLANISPLIMHHHERYDGEGYPSKLKGEEIPYLARVLTVIDSFDAMTFSRPYKPAMTYAEATMELKRCSGTQFDPVITEAFIEVLNEIQYDIDSYVPKKHEKFLTEDI